MTLLVAGAHIVSGEANTAAFLGSVRIEADRIVEVGPALSPRAKEPVIEADGRVLLPGFVDAHTHAVYAGDRLDEFELKQRGKTYLEILESGGGILSTVRA